MNFLHFATFDFQVAEVIFRTGRSLPQALSFFRESGYTHISAALASVASREWIESVRDAGLDLFQIYAGVDWRDSNGRKSQIDRLAAAAETFMPESMMVIPAEYPDLPFDVIDENLNELGGRLSGLGVQMEMEDFDMGDSPRSYASSSGLLRYMNAVPALRCCFDTGNFVRSGENNNRGTN